MEGIGNLYEFDAGPLSGWTYTVNGAFVGLGSSQVAVKSGDVICWMYTCDLGKDVGDDYMTKKKQGIEETEDETEKEDVP